MLRRGDTLIEVTLAIGIFSLVAIAITAVLSSGTSGAQTALESTLAREEIDTQAEALRYIHTAYNVSKNDQDSKYRDLWTKISEKAIENADDSVLQYSPTSCNEIYDEKTRIIKNENAFIINPRALGDFNKSGKDIGDVLITGDKLNSAATYPRLIFSNEVGTDPDGSSIISSFNITDVTAAEGIYVIAVKDAGTTNIVTNEEMKSEVSVREKQSAFYDFFIRTCWYGSGADAPSTISTVIRLSDPDAIQAAQIGDVNITYTYGDYDPAHGKKVYLPTPEKPGFGFDGWCSGTVNNDGTCNGDIYRVDDPVTNPNLTPLNLTLTPIWKNAYTIRYHNGGYTQTQTCNQTPGYFNCVTRGAIKEDNRIQTSWCRNNEQSCQSSNRVGFGDSVDVDSFNNNRTLDLYAVWQDKTFTINYNSNGGSYIGNTTCTMSNLNDCKVSSISPSLYGYDFKGWCNGVANGSSCSGITYQPGSSISATASGSSMTLSALWSIKYFNVRVVPHIDGVWWSGYSFSLYRDGVYQGDLKSYSASVPFGTTIEAYAHECRLIYCRPRCWSNEHLGVSVWADRDATLNITWHCYNS